jgi:hypothetical protein
VSDQELNDLLKSFDNPNHCYQQRLVDAIRLLVKERDEARRECRLLLLGREVLHGVRDLPAPPDDLVTIVPVPQKEDGK